MHGSVTDPVELFAKRPRGATPRLALGTMNFGKRTSAADAERILARALEHGIRVFDTANAYVDGESERILGRFAKHHRGELAIATKVGFGRVAGKPEGLRPERVLAAIDESLERLGTDRVELYYLHVPDHAVPIDETLGAMKAILDVGKARAFGVSNYASWEVLRIFHTCDRLGMPRPVVAQQLYNLLIRQLDVEYARFADEHALHTTVYNPLAGGLLTGRYGPDAEVARGSRFDKNKLYLDRYWSPLMLEHADRYRELAESLGLSTVELAYAWLATRDVVDSVLVGPASVEHLDAAVASYGSTVPAEVLARIEALSREQLGTATTYAR
jgi:aryl-alcohol dehydrogenase-like predicted oxidoreductase